MHTSSAHPTATTPHGPAAPPAPGPSTLGDATLEIRPWTDPVVDELGHDPRSHYVEHYWLGILGPSM